jgi:hypothetical protein
MITKAGLTVSYFPDRHPTNYIYLVASVPLKIEFIVSVKATARGTVSDIPIVKGLGPRDAPTGIEVVLNVTLPQLSDRDIKAGLVLPPVVRAGTY